MRLSLRSRIIIALGDDALFGNDLARRLGLRWWNRGTMYVRLGQMVEEGLLLRERVEQQGGRRPRIRFRVATEPSDAGDTDREPMRLYHRLVAAFDPRTGKPGRLINNGV